MEDLIGVGLDLVDLERFRTVLERTGERFVSRVFSEAERYHDMGDRAAEHYAARFAAKEAFLKALGTGLSKGIRWREMAVLTEAGGKPALRLSGRAQEVARDKGVAAVHLSLTHTGRTAGAVVVLAR